MLMRILSMILWLGCTVQIGSHCNGTQPTDSAALCTDIRSEGQCLPFEIGEVRISGSIDVSDSEVMDLCFTSDDELIVVTRAGEVSSCSISQNQCVNMIELDEGYWRLRALSSDALVVWEPDENAEYRCYTRRGDLVWSYRCEGTVGMPIIDGSSLLVPRKRPDGQSDVVVLHRDGQVSQTIDLGVRVLFDLLPSDIGVLVLDRHTAPQVLARSEAGYILEPWMNGSLQGVARNSTCDSAGRLVSLEMADTQLRIVDPTSAAVESVLVWGKEVDGQWQEEFPFPDYSMIASNGETVAILQPNRLLKYADGQLTVWIDNFNRLGFDLHMRDFVVDSPCSHFLVLEPDGMLVGGDQVQRLSFDGSVPVWNDFEFSPDRRTAAVGTSEGKVIIIEMGAS